MGGAELRVDGVEPVEHASRRPDGAHGIVLVCSGDAEGGHDRVADELLDRAALGLDLLAHRPEIAIHHLSEALWVELLSELG